MSWQNALREPLRSSRPVQVLARALERGRLAHAILLHGEDFAVLEETALALAGALLGAPHPEKHPDFFTIRPAKKGRQIGVDGTRQLIRLMQHTPLQGGRKAAVVFEADRMNDASANAFLKTLEEPPEGAFILLLTTRPHDLLPTIRSRCPHFRIPAGDTAARDKSWRQWLLDYRDWLETVWRGAENPDDLARAVMGAYGLVTRYQAAASSIAGALWQEEKEHLPAGLGEEEIQAHETGARRGLRRKLFLDIEQATRQFARERPEADRRSAARALTGAVDELERAAGLLEVYLRDEVALEHFLLFSMQVWSRRCGAAD